MREISMAFSPEIAEWPARGFEVNPDGCLTAYTGTDVDVEIPEGVTKIGDSVFYNCQSLHSVTISSTVRTLGIRAFARCRSLTSVVLPEGLVDISDYAFEECDRLQSVVLPNSVRTLGIRAFACCRSLTSVVLSNSVRTLGIKAFVRCRSLTFVVLSEGLVDVEALTFENCPSLQVVAIPDSVQTVDARAFEGCGSLKFIQCSEQRWQKLQEQDVFATDVRRLDLSKAVVIQNNSKYWVFEKSPVMDRHRRLIRNDLVWRSNRQQLRDLGVGDAWLMLMCLNHMMRKVHCCHVPHEMWSRVLFFLLGMNTLPTNDRDGVAIIRNISGEVHDQVLRDLSDEKRAIPHNQRLFDRRFGLVLTVPVSQLDAGEDALDLENVF